MLVFVSACVSAWNDCSCLGCQFHSSSCLVNSRSGATMLAKSAMNRETYCAMPSRERTSDGFVGRLAFEIDSSFFGSARSPFAPKTCP